MTAYVAWSKWDDAVSAKRVGLDNLEEAVCERLEGDCRRGFDWSQRHEIVNGNDCPMNVSRGFYQGCLKQVSEQFSDLARDDIE